MNRGINEKRIRDANIKVFSSIDFERYEANSSIFESSRQKDIDNILRNISTTVKENVLDIGCGTGNILRLAKSYFNKCYGLDISVKLLSELKRRENVFYLTAGEASYLPYKSNKFDLVTLNGVLHHIIHHRPVFKEIQRVTKIGGILYIDHDPNYFFNRFYHIFYRLRYLNKTGFGTRDADLSEYYHSQASGINPLKIKEQLLDIGFGEVKVHFRITTNPDLPLSYKVVRAVLKTLTKVYPAKSFFTHFWILARK